MKKNNRLLLCAGLLAAASGMAKADEVTHWNNVLLDLYRLDYGTGCPCPLSRAGAITQAAVFDAVNSIDRTHRPFVRFVPASTSASKEAAVIAAAHTALRDLFPDSAVTLDAQYATRMALIADGPAKTEGIAVGIAAANDCLLSRAEDGSQTPESYEYGTSPGDYIPTPPGFSTECNPEWVNVTPFCMASGDQFRPNPLGFTSMAELVASPEYAAEVNEAKDLGGSESTSRTEEQLRIAFFWANDVNGTYKPPGHLFAITQTVSADQKLTLSENARLFALVGLAMGDAGIAAWDAKWGTDIDLWRPISAIRHADIDNNPLTVADPKWQAVNGFSPPFPAYISGHATFGGAHAGVMAEFFGTDDVTFTVDSEDPFYNALPVHGPRTFNSFSAAAIENGLSRVYLGVHYRMDAVDGNAVGFQIGHLVGANFLAELCLADYDGDGVSNSNDFFSFVEDFLAMELDGDINRDGVTDTRDFFDFLTSYFAGC